MLLWPKRSCTVTQLQWRLEVLQWRLEVQLCLKAQEEEEAGLGDFPAASATVIFGHSFMIEDGSREETWLTCCL